MVDFPELTTERLDLRALRFEDAEAVYAVFSDGEVTRYYDLERFTELEQASDLITRFRNRFEQKQGTAGRLSSKKRTV